MGNFINYFLLMLLILCAICDLKANKIPNIVTMSFVMLAVMLHSFNNGFDGFLFSAIGLATGIGLLLIPYIMSGMGAGDVKLMGAVGAFLGARATFEAFLLIAIAGGGYSLALILIRRDVFKGFFSEKVMTLSSMVMLRQYVPIQTQTESSGQKPRLKYGVAIAFGTIAYLLLNSFGIKFFA